mgnify:CR=1 FL=1
MTYKDNKSQEVDYERVNRMTEIERVVRIAEIIRTIPNLDFKLNFGGLESKSWQY